MERLTGVRVTRTERGVLGAALKDMGGVGAGCVSHAHLSPGQKRSAHNMSRSPRRWFRRRPGEYALLWELTRLGRAVAEALAKIAHTLDPGRGVVTVHPAEAELEAEEQRRRTADLAALEAAEADEILTDTLHDGGAS